MYQNVYIDAVFAANFLMDYILLRLTGFFIREGRNRRRCLMAAAGGALFSSISLCIPADQIPRLWSIGQIFCAAGIIRLAYPIRSWKRLAMAVLIFYVLAHPSQLALLHELLLHSFAILLLLLYFINLSIARSSSLIASLSPCSTASTIQCSI